MRFRLLAALVLITACSTAPPPATTVQTPSQSPAGISIRDEARILRLEDRREFDPVLAAEWASHTNPLHRARIALALGRIGTATFVDADGNGVRNGSELPAGIDSLLTLLRDPEFNVRRQAAFALGEIGDSAGAAALFEATNDEHGDVAAEAVEALSKMARKISLERYAALTAPGIRIGVRARAIRYLFRFGTDEASALAIPGLDESDPAIRVEAAYTCSRRATPGARARLEALLGTSDTMTRAHAARALAAIADPGSFDPLLAAIGDPHPWVRINAARGVAIVANATPSLFTRERQAADVAALVTLTDDPDPGTRAVAIESLAPWVPHHEAARERLFALASDGSSWQRELATSAVTRFAPEDSRLASILDQSSPAIRRAAMAAATEPLASELRDRWIGDPDVSVRATVVGTIPDENVDAEIEMIRKAIEDPDEGVRSNALDRLTLSKAEGLADIFRASEMRARADASNDVRIAAIRGIAAHDPAGNEAVRPWLGDHDPMIRRIAAEMLAGESGPPVQFTPLPIERPMSEYERIATWANEHHTASIHMPRGTIEIVLLTRDAPMTTWNFATLARKGYFDNSSFMRVVPNFVIQGGDPRNDMTGGPGYSIRDEVNTQRYTRGAVGMALSGPDTGGSQFFVTHSPQPHLDGGYTVFARVVGGMGSVADQVERGDRVSTIRIDEKPAPDPENAAAAAQTPLPVVIGPTSPERLLAVVPEYTERKASYAPDPAVLEMLAASVGPADRVEVVLGTWCDDSQREVPKFMRVADDLHEKWQIDLPSTFLAVDRTKTRPQTLVAGKNIEKVATFIYFRGDREIGRIVEKPASLFEDDLLVIAARTP